MTQILKQDGLLLVLLAYFIASGTTTAYYSSLLLIPLLLLKKDINRLIDPTFLLITFFSVSYSAITTAYGFNEDAKSNLIFYSIFPPLFYLIGKYFIFKRYPILYILLALAFLISIRSFIQIFNDIFSYQFINPLRRIDITGTNTLSATLYGALVSLSVSFIGLIFAKTSNREPIFKFFYVLLSILGLLSVVHLINRTGILIGIISIISVIIFNFKYLFRARTVILIIFVVIISLIYIYPILEEADVFKAYLDREQQTGTDIYSAGGRIERWEHGLSQLYKAPFGGGSFYEGRRYYAHNFWLDVSSMAGLISLIPLLIATTFHLIRSITVIFNKRLTIFESSIFLVLNIAFFMTSFLEPILEGSLTYVLVYFIFWGLTTEIYKKLKLFPHRS